MTILGLDYASIDANKPPDWAAEKAAGVRFAIVRASYERWADVTCARDRAAIRDAGLVFGAYMMPVMGPGHPTPEEQVVVFRSGAVLLPGRDFAPALDLEWSGGLARYGIDRAGAVKWIARAVAEIERRFGCKPLVYSSARVLDGDDADSLGGAADRVLAGCPLWLARYPLPYRVPGRFDADGWPLPPTPNIAWTGLWMHQYQGDATRVLSGTVDLDRFVPCERNEHDRIEAKLLGEHGQRVEWVQERIGADVDGDFGPLTEIALRKWQIANRLPETGAVDLETFAKLTWARPG